MDLGHEYSRAETLHQSRSATIYRAYRGSDRRSVLLKVVEPEHSARLTNEYEIGRALEGLPVLAPIELTTFEGRPALVLEDPLAGASFEEIARGPLEVGAFLELATRITGALAQIHARGVVHKDLQPANILVDPRGEIRICDLGIASRIGREQTIARPTRWIEGTLAYVSPEQTGRMNRAIDSRSDLYSLGVTFYQLLTGRLPFDADDPVGWVHSHVARIPPAPDEIRPSLPRPLSDIVMKLLAKSPDDRYQSASGLEHDLVRCLEQWRTEQRLIPFPIGTQDVSDRFLIPQKLYGRERECAVLRDALERTASTGEPELVLVAGYPGIGKTSVVLDLQRAVVERRGLFGSGKFEQLKRDVPYFTIAQTFRELALDILAQTDDTIAQWRQRIAVALGENAQLVVDLVPPVALIIGPQPAVPEQPLAEAEARLRRVLRQFISAFATRDRPLTMFLDDLQWADTASVRLLVDLVTEPEVRSVLLVGAYRDSEVDSSHPLTRALEEIRASGARVHELTLGPLSPSDVENLVADTLRCTREEAAPLAHLVHRKTGGNPFFAIAFLSALHHDGAFAFDHEALRWRWDVAEIQSRGHTDNVVDLMVHKLRGLPAETQRALRLAACMGTTTKASAIETVLEDNPEGLLRPALEEELVLHVDHSYRFAHDRVQEAAYARIPEPERQALHLRIARSLLEHAPSESLDEQIFEIVTQFDRARPLLESSAERERIAALNLRAGERAQRSAAYASARKYFEWGAALLAEDRWERHYDLAFALELHRAECESQTGELEAAETRLATLASKAASPIDAAAVASVQMQVQTMRYRPDLAVEAGLACLRRFGIDWTSNPTNESIRDEFARVRETLGDRPIESLLDLPPMADPEQRALMDVLAALHPPAFFTGETLGWLIVGRMANLSLEHGNTDASSVGYVLFGMRRGSIEGAYEEGYRFGKVGFDLAEARGFRRFRAHAVLLFAVGVSPWTRRMRESIEHLRRCFDVAIASGQIALAGYAMNSVISTMLAVGDPLSDVQREIARATELLRKSGFGLVGDIIAADHLLVRALRGLRQEPVAVGETQFDERGFEDYLVRTPLPPITQGWCWIRQLESHFFAEDYGGAIDAATRAEAVVWTVRGFVDEAEYHYFAALVRAARHDEVPAEERAAHLAALAAHRVPIERWARSSPENARDRAAIVRAELARIEGDAEGATLAYEEAIRAARDSGFIHHEAIAYERAARFHRGRGLALMADTYLRAARDRYRRWGADGKVAQIEQRHPGLVERASIGPEATLAIRPEQLDFMAVIKASQTISRAIVREDLVRTLLEVVLEEGGARRAVLALVRDGRLAHLSEARADDAPVSEPVRVPESILRYVQRTHERVLIDDALQDAGRFAGDEYLAHARPRSVLCLPIQRETEASALIYLENDLVAGAFTAERLLAIEVLAAQAAVSLENALLLEREHEARVEAEAANQRSTLLAEVTAIMASSEADDESAFESLARVCVRWFADGVFVDLVEGGEAKRVAAAHRDPGKMPILRELADLYPEHVGRAPLAAALQGGTLHDPEITDERLAAYAVGAHHLELLRALGPRSALVVPLTARRQILGSLSFVSAAAHRFGPADVELAEELGRRAALALDNARLLRRTQRALRQREEFLTVASHELRTPMTSMRLAVEVLASSTAPGGELAGDRLARVLSLILRQSDRLQRIVDELLDIRRIDQGPLRLTRAQVDLGSLVRAVVNELAADAVAAGSRVSIDAPAPVRGVWDADWLEKVIANVLSNAIKFGGGRPIDIHVRAVGGRAELVVQDRGIGIDPAKLPHVFERFERGVPWAHYGGLGMGLYVARSIVEAHGGSIRLESQLDAGTKVTVELPLQAPS